jgi:hypothetical protein
MLFLGSCSSSRFYDHRFQPAPLEVQVATQAMPGAQVRALVAAIGIERAREERAAGAIVRIRLENLGTAPVVLETDTLSLVSADLKAFQPGRIESATLEGRRGEAGTGPAEGRTGGGIEIRADQSGAYEIAFPLPKALGASAVDLSGLNLRFTLRFGDERVTTGASFQRVEALYGDPGYPRVHVGVGYGWWGCD